MARESLRRGPICHVPATSCFVPSYLWQFECHLKASANKLNPHVFDAGPQKRSSADCPVLRLGVPRSNSSLSEGVQSFMICIQSYAGAPEPEPDSESVSAIGSWVSMTRGWPLQTAGTGRFMEIPTLAVFARRMLSDTISQCGLLNS